MELGEQRRIGESETGRSMWSRWRLCGGLLPGEGLWGGREAGGGVWLCRQAFPAPTSTLVVTPAGDNQSLHSGGSPETGCGEGAVAHPAPLHRLRCPEGAPLSQLVPVKAGDGTGKQNRL